MGPHSFKCGKQTIEARIWSLRRCFNGAALFQVRKAKNLTTSRNDDMVLQWGRTLSSAERTVNREPGPTTVRASMGPHSFKCGKFTPKQYQALTELLLQWGRTLSSAESLDQRWIVAFATTASMGPHSFKCGKVPSG